MGHMVHNAIVVTSWSDDYIKVVRQKADDIFAVQVSEVISGIVNGYSSFLIPPSGSKRGWSDAYNHTESLERFKKFLREDLSGEYVDWTEVQFGDADDNNKITDGSKTTDGSDEDDDE